MGALSNIRIVDLTRLLPGPFGTTVLADLGAEVVKVESPLEDDWARSLSGFFASINRGKKSVSLNLKKLAGKEIFFRLVESAEAVAEQFRPGVMDKLGVGFEPCRKHNPKIVYASLSGYGADGPYADKAGHDLNYLSLAGIEGVTGAEDGELAIPGVQVADQVGGLYLAIAILAGLNQARTRGEAVKIDVSIFESALSLLGPHLSEFFRTQRQPGPAGMELNGLLPNYHLYQTRDGRWLSLAALEGKFWANFCKAVARPDWELRLLGDGQEHKKLKKEIAELFASRPLKEWEELMARAPDLCLEPVRKFSEIENDPQIQARETLVELEGKPGTRFRVVRSPVRMAGAEKDRPGPAPKRGADTESILKELGYSGEDISRFRQEGVI